MQMIWALLHANVLGVADDLGVANDLGVATC